MKSFGDYANESGGSNLEAGMYGALVESAELALDDNNQPKQNQYGKQLLDVVFCVDSDNRPRRRFSISFGKNVTNGKYSPFAEFIEAATGIKCGDKAQRKATVDDVVGKTVRITMKENDNGYMDVTDVLPPGKKTAAPKAQASGFAPEPEEIPFPEEP